MNIADFINDYFILILIGVGLIIYFFSSIYKMLRENKELQKENESLRANEEAVHQYENNLQKRIKSIEKSLSEREQDVSRKEMLFGKLMSERRQNFPSVTKAYIDAEAIVDELRTRQMRYKKRPSLKAAEQIKEINAEKRDLIRKMREYKVKADEYEAVAPWLLEDLEEDIQNQIISEEAQHVYSEAEREDPATLWLKPEEYRTLSPTERNQLMIERYFQHGKKSHWKIGMMYERYVGYLYEKDGWDVEYFGIKNKYSDLGRDIIARKGKNIDVVQCKNWSKFKDIHENALCQLFGTATAMSKERKGCKVTPIFYTTTTLTDVAKEFAKKLGIKVHENAKLVEYPVVKCNISKSGEKIYHLPSDQQYDNICITTRTGEFYAKTVKEAEVAGFRRAFKWRGSAEK